MVVVAVVAVTMVHLLARQELRAEVELVEAVTALDTEHMMHTAGKQILAVVVVAQVEETVLIHHQVETVVVEL